jgi:hypothetical protein
MRVRIVSCWELNHRFPKHHLKEEDMNAIQEIPCPTLENFTNVLLMLHAEGYVSTGHQNLDGSVIPPTACYLSVMETTLD